MSEQDTKARTFARNKKALHDYHVIDSWETGVVLMGPEVKSIRAGKASLQDAFARIHNGEVWLYGMHVSPYDPASRWNVDPVRTRKLLLSKDQIRDLTARVFEKGLTLVPLDLHFRNGYAKVTIAVARGRRKYDKREAIKRREMDREADRHAGRR